jgi:hypothetical protein
MHGSMKLLNCNQWIACSGQHGTELTLGWFFDAGQRSHRPACFGMDYDGHLCGAALELWTCFGMAFELIYAMGMAMAGIY